MSSFDARAKEWDKSDRRQALARAVAECIEGSIDRPVSILDFGCGTGLVSYNLTHLATKIVGVDSSAKMREVFNEKSTSSNIYATDTIPDERFNVILTSMTLHHIEDVVSLAKEFFDHLENGGLLFVADLYKEDGTFHDHGNEGVAHFGFDPKELRAIFEKVGFKFVDENEVFRIQKKKEYPIFCMIFRKT